MSTILTFHRKEIMQLIEAAKTHRKDIHLIGDEGIYFGTSTGKDTSVVVFATECNPATSDVETWSRVKREAFPEDGVVETVNLDSLVVWTRRASGPMLVLELTNRTIAYLFHSGQSMNLQPPSHRIVDVKNDGRAARAKAALETYIGIRQQQLTASAAQIADLIADLLHLAAYQGYGPRAVEGIVNLARVHRRNDDDITDIKPQAARETNAV